MRHSLDLGYMEDVTEIERVVSDSINSRRILHWVIRLKRSPGLGSANTTEHE